MAEAEVYRLALASEVPNDAWKTRLQWTTVYKGVKGLDDKFIHCSTAEQLSTIAESNFAGKSDVMLLRFSVETMAEEADLKVVMEGAPHVYGGAIPYACLGGPPVLLELGPDGKHMIPQLGAAAAEEEAIKDAAREEEEGIERGFDDEDGYDGGAARGMWG